MGWHIPGTMPRRSSVGTKQLVGSRVATCSESGLEDIERRN